MNKVADYRGIMAKIKAEMLAGKLTVDEAMIKAQPFINEMNQKAAKIAKEYGKKHKPFTFGYIMR